MEVLRDRGGLNYLYFLENRSTSFFVLLTRIGDNRIQILYLNNDRN